MEDKTMIEIKDLKKSFGKNIILDGVNEEVKKGQVICVIGPSGAGKSTFLRCLNLLEEPSAGAVLFEGQNLVEMGAKEVQTVREKMGMVFQGFNLFPNMTVLDNVTLAPIKVKGMDKEQAQKLGHQLLSEVDMDDKADAYPLSLSGGQKQRVAIARALATDPKVLLCDEATSALDPTTTNSILALLKELNQKLGVTVVIITHQMSVIEEICTRVAILDGGEVAEEGRVEDIFAHPATDAARRLVYPGGVSAKQYPAGTRAVRVSFNGGTVYDPLIASLAIDCGVKVTILGADTRTIDGKAFGTMLLLLPDDPNEAAKALSYIRSQPNITAEEVEYHA